MVLNLRKFTFSRATSVSGTFDNRIHFWIPYNIANVLDKIYLLSSFDLSFIRNSDLGSLAARFILRVWGDQSDVEIPMFLTANRFKQAYE